MINKGNKQVRPLSAINDMIGAQSTKGIHVISKYASRIERTGVWKSEDNKLSIIETYPSVNKSIKIPKALEYEKSDIQDAYICARIAYFFNTNREKLVEIPKGIAVPEREGWIWYLRK
jgi:hypothetical protein